MSSGGQQRNGNVKQGLLAAYRRFMAPLVRILIRNGISFNEFADELRGVYVDVAAKDFPIEGRSPSGTRIAILTGLTRKEVKRQIERYASETRVTSDVNRVNRVLDGWHQDPEFTGPYALPLELRFDESQGDIPSFVELVRRYSGDMSARAMLDELLRVNAVEVLPEGESRALTKSYISATLDPAVVNRLGRVIANLAETLDYNFFQAKEPAGRRFERTVYTGIGIDHSVMPEFEELVRDKGQIFLETLDHFISAHESSEEDSKNKKLVKTGVGLYHYIVDE